MNMDERSLHLGAIRAKRMRARKKMERTREVESEIDQAKLGHALEALKTVEKIIHETETILDTLDFNETLRKQKEEEA